MHLICVPPALVARVWPHVRELILAAMRRGDLSAFRPVEASVLAGNALLWLAWGRVGKGAVSDPSAWAKSCARCAPTSPVQGECPARALQSGRAGRSLRSPARRAHAEGLEQTILPTLQAGIAAAAVTEIADTEWRRVCVVVACGGRDMRAWLPLIDGIEAYARAHRCAAVRIVGRRGWARVLAQYKTKRIILEKEL
jgi:hypothetical protein